MVKAKEIKCAICGNDFAYLPEDVKHHGDKKSYVVCPICGNEIKI